MIGTPGQRSSSLAPALILFSGLPGCGKTTLARQVATALSAPLLAKDRVQRLLRDHCRDATGAEGYHFLFDLADEQLGLGVSVILDAVFPQADFRAQVRAIATRQGARFRAIHCYCSDEALWQARLADRVAYVPGWPPVGWAEVERLRGSYTPWSQAEALFVDAVQPVERNLAAVLAYLQEAA